MTNTYQRFTYKEKTFLAFLALGTVSIYMCSYDVGKEDDRTRSMQIRKWPWVTNLKSSVMNVSSMGQSLSDRFKYSSKVSSLNDFLFRLTPSPLWKKKSCCIFRYLHSHHHMQLMTQKFRNQNKSLTEKKKHKKIEMDLSRLLKCTQTQSIKMILTLKENDLIVSFCW